ncbi:autotransporter-associated beta strand repeat-containing protein [Achromobacter insuavis]
MINGGGQVIQQGSGTTVFNAINGYTGGTTVAAGGLAVGDAGHADAAINSGGPVTVQAEAASAATAASRATSPTPARWPWPTRFPAWAAPWAASPSPATWSTAAWSTWAARRRATC